MQLKFNRDNLYLLGFSVTATLIVGFMVRLPFLQSQTGAVVSSIFVDLIVLMTLIPTMLSVGKMKNERFSLKIIIYILAFSSLCSVASMTLVTLIKFLTGFPERPHINNPMLVFIYYTVICFLWLMGTFWNKTQKIAIQEAQKATDAQNAAIVSELRRMRMQLDPHFLFNVMNSTLVEISQNPKRASIMMKELMSYLRYSLDHADIDFVPLAAEVAMVRSYMRLQDIRFGAMLKYRVDIQPGLKNRRIPTFLLQPIVENASKYGVVNENNEIHIRVDARSEDGKLVITVINTGNLALSRSKFDSTGTGLANIKARLAMHYPDRYEFEMRQVEQEVWAICRLTGEPC